MAPIALQSFHIKAIVIGTTADPMKLPMAPYTQPSPMPISKRIVAMIPEKIPQTQTCAWVWVRERV